MDDKLVLIADDVAFMRGMIHMTLTEAGFKDVIEATDGHEAVDLFRENHPDLVILDITMERKNGLDALAEIIEIDPKARVVMCTATDQQQTAFEAISLGASDYVIKPFRKDKLIEACTNVLSIE